ncbi:MAG: hypothetical protein M1840_001751 [Geoglossum simile]|nr:MAG: hypothetical protein M1840_001751 [Geoglossum simile]
MICSENPSTPLKLLSLDGGGIRGLSSLIILKHLMKSVNPKNPPKPCEYFDLIGGTSTGGVIALMLGRLEMDVDTCIERYIELYSRVLKKKKKERKLCFLSSLFQEGKSCVFSRLMNTEVVGGPFSLGSPSSGVQAIIPLQEDEALEEKLINPEASCKTFVCAFGERADIPIHLRTYTPPGAIYTPAYQECTIREASRATCAATPLYKPIEIPGQWFGNGDAGLNNPVDVVFNESQFIWPCSTSRIQCLVSIGTGVPSPENPSVKGKQAVNPLNAICAKSEETDNRFYKTIGSIDLSNRYFRYSVPNAMGDVDETDKIEYIITATECYLEFPLVRRSIDALTQATVPKETCSFLI